MPYFLHTAENTYFIVFNITCKMRHCYTESNIFTQRGVSVSSAGLSLPDGSERQTVHKNKSSEGGA